MNETYNLSLRTQCNANIAFGLIDPLSSISVRDTHETRSELDIVTLTRERMQSSIAQGNTFRGEAFKKILTITLLRLLTDETNKQFEALRTYEANGEIWALIDEARTKIDFILRTTPYHQWCSDDDL
ncbi:MAG: hypothetical protein U0518_03470 [Candidatus Gracilibacteria bacterium]